jgi:hypothetical protein
MYLNETLAVAWTLATAGRTTKQGRQVARTPITDWTSTTVGTPTTQRKCPKNRNANSREAYSSRDSNNRIDAHNSSDDITTSDGSFFNRDTEHKKNINKGKDNSKIINSNSSRASNNRNAKIKKDITPAGTLLTRNKHHVSDSRNAINSRDTRDGRRQEDMQQQSRQQ